MSTSTTPVTDSTPLPAGPVDLRGLYRRIGHHWDVAPKPGAEPRRHTIVVEPDPAEIDVKPAQIIGFIDGIQHRRLLARRGSDRRPVSLEYAAACCLRLDDRNATSHVERAAIHCGYLDAEWARDMAAGELPVLVANERWAEDITNAATSFVDQLRRDVESLICREAEAPTGTLLLRDGNLAESDPTRADLIGVVKQAETVYPGAEDVGELRAGWRGPVLLLPARRADMEDVWTCHVRLHDQPWLAPTEGIIRVEARRRDLLEPVAAACMAMRQGARSGDARWATHLAPVALVERVARAHGAAFYA